MAITACSGVLESGVTLQYGVKLDFVSIKPEPYINMKSKLSMNFSCIYVEWNLATPECLLWSLHCQHF